jgi:hypothetical protein
MPLADTGPEAYAPDSAVAAPDLKHEHPSDPVVECLLSGPPRRNRIGDVVASAAFAVARVNRYFAGHVVLDHY